MLKGTLPIARPAVRGPLFSSRIRYVVFLARFHYDVTRRNTDAYSAFHRFTLSRRERIFPRPHSRGSGQLRRRVYIRLSQKAAHDTRRIAVRRARSVKLQSILIHLSAIVAQSRTAKRIWSHFDVVPEERESLESISRRSVQFRDTSVIRVLLSCIEDARELLSLGTSYILLV